MSVLRLNEFKALPGQFEALAKHFEAIVAQIRTIDGNQSCELLLKMADGASDDEVLVVIETWESLDHHKAAVSAIDPAQLAAVMALLDGPPKGRYYTPLEQRAFNLTYKLNARCGKT
ncbi:antibiotic biosynthesis monooxygenase family protein [Asticcacaulis sp. EMRT-3]|uniref:antibiotic biosynthesis monooxygenase family protein n=1 Tax=Asticcacaulis sp. EMRT-3 TaxID=3040349 RepID=UPI0024AEA6DF|nr:antibiotic biosynthesis monooxygenase family protein [Asticcacaulis sp. EMRT-3]MDI7776203.1 antibiotic biosynthesis monooxygenase [Asticcacaulis sp. EMRT-3]